MRYFLDTSCLIGVTFLHDRWYPEAKRLFETDNTFLTGRRAAFEYCCSTRTNSKKTADISLEREDGRFGEKQAELRLNQSKFDKQIQSYDDFELDVDTVLDDFISLFKMKEVEEEEVKPRMRKYFEKYFAKAGEVTQETARAAARDLKDVLLWRSFKHKAMIEARVHHEPIRDRNYPDLVDSMKQYPPRIDNTADIDLLCDAYYLVENREVKKMITGDYVDIFSNADWIWDKMGLRVLYLTNKFAGEEETSIPPNAMD